MISTSSVTVHGIHQLAWPERSELPSTSGLPFASKRTRMPRRKAARRFDERRPQDLVPKKKTFRFSTQNTATQVIESWTVFFLHSKTFQNKWWKVKKKRLRDIWMQINIKLCSWLVFFFTLSRNFRWSGLSMHIRWNVNHQLQQVFKSRIGRSRGYVPTKS